MNENMNKHHSSLSLIIGQSKQNLKFHSRWKHKDSVYNYLQSLIFQNHLEKECKYEQILKSKSEYLTISNTNKYGQRHVIRSSMT